MDTQIEIDSKEVVEFLTYLRHAAADLRQPFDVIGQYLVSETQLRFRKGVDPEGNLWKPSQRVLKEGGQTLVKTGRLSKSITHKTTKDSLSIGTNIKYGPAHQFGWQRKHIPARPYLGLNLSRDLPEIERVLFNYLTKKPVNG